MGPVQEFFERLQRIGYAACYSVEIMNAHYQHEDPLQIARRAMDTTCRMAGLPSR